MHAFDLVGTRERNNRLYASSANYPKIAFLVLSALVVVTGSSYSGTQGSELNSLIFSFDSLILDTVWCVRH